ncbi:MAG: hypothetical protein J1F20_05630 [Muribaculaceae bacterium]|nr:hypothetical protein [Muribaculaceae bacterium]
MEVSKNGKTNDFYSIKKEYDILKSVYNDGLFFLKKKGKDSEETLNVLVLDVIDHIFVISFTKDTNNKVYTLIENLFKNLDKKRFTLLCEHDIFPHPCAMAVDEHLNKRQEDEKFYCTIKEISYETGCMLV